MKANSEALSLEKSMTVRESILQEVQYKTPDIKNGNGYSSHYTATKFYILSKQEYLGKRSLDLFLSSLGLIVLGLVYPIIALGIKLSSKGPVIFRQVRTGRNGYPFTCLKFRTMHSFQKKGLNGKPDITRRGDARVFWFGQVLRRLNIDELPQLVNVFRGEMSLVGPRPYDVKECAYWNNKFSDHFYRYAVKPGISGLAQVKGYRGGTLDEEHMRKRLDHDLIYVEKCSIKVDLKIILRTILQMIHLDTKAH